MSKEYSCYAYLNHSRVLSWSGLENFLYETETIQSFSKNKCIIYIHISMVKKYFTVGIWNFFKQSECILFKKSCLLQKLCFWTVFLKIFYVFLKYCVENDFLFNFMIFLKKVLVFFQKIVFITKFRFLNGIFEKGLKYFLILKIFYLFFKISY